MHLLSQHGRTKVYLLQDSDMTLQLAKNIATIQGNAYEARFPEVPRRIINERFSIDPDKNASDLLKQMKSLSGFWLVAYRDKKPVGFGCFKVVKTDKLVIVTELHTDLKVARGLRVGTAVLLEGLDHAKTLGAKRAEVSVGRRSQRDTFPSGWFKILGFKETDKVDYPQVGHLKFTRHRMEADISRVTPYLNRQLARFSE